MAIAADHIWCIDFPGERNSHLLLAEVEQRLGSQDIIDGAPPYGNGPPGAMADVVPCLPCPSRCITRTVISGSPLDLELRPLWGSSLRKSTGISIEHHAEEKQSMEEDMHLDLVIA